MMILMLMMAWMLAVQCVLFHRAGEKWWLGLIPVYGTYKYYEIIGCKRDWLMMLGISGFYLLLMLLMRQGRGDSLLFVVSSLSIGYLSGVIYFNVHCCNRLARAFGKGRGFGAGIFFFPMIFKAMLAFGDGKYTAPAAQEADQPAAAPREYRPVKQVRISGGRYAKGHEPWHCPHCGIMNPSSAQSCMNCGK